MLKSSGWMSLGHIENMTEINIILNELKVEVQVDFNGKGLGLCLLGNIWKVLIQSKYCLIMQSTY